jgi:hypothetical protein
MKSIKTLLEHSQKVEILKIINENKSIRNVSNSIIDILADDVPNFNDLS